MIFVNLLRFAQYTAIYWFSDMYIMHNNYVGEKKDGKYRSYDRLYGFYTEIMYILEKCYMRYVIFLELLFIFRIIANFRIIVVILEILLLFFLLKIDQF